jgi:hypothetical protein
MPHWTRSTLLRYTISDFFSSLLGADEASFMDYDLGYFDLETRELEPLENPFGPKVFVASVGGRNTRFENIRWSLPV